MLRVLGISIAAVGLMAAAPADWRPLDPENTLVIESTKGRIVVELRPEFAPKGVERIKLLAREGVYSGLQFHRVIDGFVAQTGNPNNRDGGVSVHPDLAPEFSFRVAPDLATVVNARSDAREGFVGATPFQATSAAEQSSTDPRLRGWGAYCPGVMGMGRQAEPGTANSEIFFMRGPARRLDHEYTVVGRVVSGSQAVNAVAVGEPPKVPDLMLKVRMLADIPEAERPKLEVMDTRGPAFQARLAAAKREKGAAFTVCDVEIPIRTR
ncbi:MAG: peptidylprolyl isomerase [Alphaproteobacteria bacterium]|nr:peptidylprolyl isomerase [Alphaproteobacteria bacterium]MBU1516357.1 peptidylprolyl isomerase [Alphaproteobacteria bacterium]MBU2093406.1 peptidylprolyl isomerase [Alphaproteobacteria bacterium]MBU2153893.1 peptidylprolyl isomerase [Alphaproteobacteria bacterium]MBU2307765.1 peptidylprolyl isomerase [Alphaproteobacteria bacterium]